MLAYDFSITPRDLWRAIGSADAPLIVDVRRREVFDSAPGILPGAVWRDISTISALNAETHDNRPIVFACKAGHELSQTAAARLRTNGVRASVLAGGYDAWAEARLPLISKSAYDRFISNGPSVWVTRRRPKIDRVACPWLIRRFIDPQARVLYVDPGDVGAVAREIGAVPFDIDGVELSHEGPRCSFDTMLRIFGLETDSALSRIALIVRGADTARLDLAPEAAGLLAVSLGLSAQAGDDDHGMIERGFIVYDALLAWARFAADERHNWPAGDEARAAW
jgi:rhodanese-related sulfurtransferase